MSKSKIGVLSIIILLLVSLSVGLSRVQAYNGPETINLDFGTSEQVTVPAPISGVTFVVNGTLGATGSITIQNYTDNPYPAADIPTGISLGRFVQITFDISSDNFTQAQVTIAYTDNDVAGFNQPYSVYKYLETSNSYVEFPSNFDMNTNTVTVTFTDVNDPILAIGGSTGETPGPDSTVTWIIVAVSVVIVVVLAVFIVFRWRKT